MSAPRVVVVGAGVAGLGAAGVLARAGVAVTVLEKSRGTGGRAATRWRDAAGARWHYDHGAQVLDLVLDGGATLRRVLGTALVPLGATWPLGGDGRPDPSAAREEPRWGVAGGMNHVGRALVEAVAGADLRLNTTVSAVRAVHGGWCIETADGDALTADAVLVTVPSPQAAPLVAPDSLAEALAAVPYRAQFAVVWAFAGAAPRPEPFALVAPGSTEPDLAWLAAEGDKPGRAPSGGQLLVAQLTDAWTRERFDAPREAVVAEAAQAVERVLGARLPAPLFTDTQRWRYSLPDRALAADARAGAESRGLFVAGDGAVGQGRVPLALADGEATGARICAWLGA